MLKMKGHLKKKETKRAFNLTKIKSRMSNLTIKLTLSPMNSKKPKTKII